MKVAIARERISEQSAKWRMLALLVNQLLLGGERKQAQVLGILNAREFKSGSARFLLIELIGRYLAEEFSKSLVLQLSNLIRGKQLKPAIVEVDS